MFSSLLISSEHRHSMYKDYESFLEKRGLYTVFHRINNCLRRLKKILSFDKKDMPYFFNVFIFLCYDFQYMFFSDAFAGHAV